MTHDWDGWPDGNFEQDFTEREFEERGKLQVHWAMTVNGGDRKGKKDALTWEAGKRSTRLCLGVIECDDPLCRIVIRPHTKRTDKQLQNACKCGATLKHKTCSVISVLHTWSDGVHFSNSGFHTHRRPTHVLHLLPHEQLRFEEIVKSHPSSGPLQLIVRLPGIHGPGESVADISDVLVNAQRVSKERQKIKRGNILSADGLIAAFAKFEAEHPNFIIHSTIGEVTVISCQTNFMRSQLVKSNRLESAVNGTVNDAAHGYWRERNSLLMVSSTYSPGLLCWVPGVLSYTNGASEAHFTYHFFAVFQSIRHEANSRGITLIDEHFAGVSGF